MDKKQQLAIQVHSFQLKDPLRFLGGKKESQLGGTVFGPGQNLVYSKREALKGPIPIPWIRLGTSARDPGP